MTHTATGWTMTCPYEGSKWSGLPVNLDHGGQCEHAGKCHSEIPCAWDDTEPGAKREEKKEIQ